MAENIYDSFQNSTAMKFQSTICVRGVKKKSLVLEDMLCDATLNPDY